MSDKSPQEILDQIFGGLRSNDKTDQLAAIHELEQISTLAERFSDWNA